MIEGIAALAREAVISGCYIAWNDFLEERGIKSTYKRKSGLFVAKTAVKTNQGGAQGNQTVIDVFVDGRWDLVHVLQVIANHDANKHERWMAARLMRQILRIRKRTGTRRQPFNYDREVKLWREAASRKAWGPAFFRR